MKLANNQVQVPLLFSLRHRTHSPHKTSYLLGTLHVRPLSILPDQCMTVIESCSSFVTEQSYDDADVSEYYTKAILRGENSPNWFSELSSEIADFVEKAVETYFEYYEPDLKKPAQALELWAAYHLAYQGFIIMLAAGNSDISNTDHQESLPMDHELMLNVFKDGNAGLETKMGNIPILKIKASGIQVFDELFQISKIALSTEEQSHELEEVISNYYNGGLFYNHQNAKEENEDSDTIDRNIRWIPNIAKHHAELPGSVLFGVGALHLIGEQGLLALLPKHGFEIARLKPDGSFQEYVYPFQSDTIAKTALARECFMLRFTSTSNSEAPCRSDKSPRLKPAPF